MVRTSRGGLGRDVNAESANESKEPNLGVTATEVAEVRPGIWAIPVRIPIPGLDVVFAYALELDDGVLLIDSGTSHESSSASLEEGLRSLGASIEQVRGAVFTHAHGDHYGLASTIRDRSGAWIALTAADHPLVEDLRQPPERREDVLRAWYRLSGVEGDALDAFLAHTRFRCAFEPALPDQVLAAGDHVALCEWDLAVLATPGHTPDHVCLLEERTGVVFTGDHLLAWTTANVSVSPYSSTDPLGDYLTSLSASVSLGNRLGLPGHEAVIPSVADRAGEILLHHDEQLSHTELLVKAGATTIAEVAERMPWARSWDRLSVPERRQALGEAHAHLVRLERSGRLRPIGGEPLMWTSA